MSYILVLSEALSVSPAGEAAIPNTHKDPLESLDQSWDMVFRVFKPVWHYSMHYENLMFHSQHCIVSLYHTFCVILVLL